MKNFLIGLLIVVGFLVLIALGYTFMFTDGIVQSKYNNTVGIKVDNSERNRYEHSASYIEGKAQELAKVKAELITEKDKAARKALIEMVNSDCANLDINDLNDSNLREFLEQVRDGDIN